VRADFQCFCIDGSGIGRNNAGEIYGAERGGSIPMAERILRRLPIDLRIWRDRMK
jgi:hypothetical protein